MKTGQKLENCSHKPKNVRGSQKLEEVRKETVLQVTEGAQP